MTTVTVRSGADQGSPEKIAEAAVTAFFLVRQLADAARDYGDDLTWLLLGNLAVDADRCTRWSTALARYAIEQRVGNQDVLRRWVARWTPRAEAAAAGLGQLLSAGRPAIAVEQAANSARRRALNEAGLA